MRKFAGVLFATVLVLPIGMVASQAGAAGGTTCKTAAGTATFTPPLPPLSSKALVKNDVLKASGTLGKCTGGGVTAGKTTVSTPKSKTGSNCSTLLKFSTTPTTGTEVITWNTKATSTVAIKLGKVKNKATQATVTGTVTAGLFKGMKQSGTVTFAAVPKTGCASTPLAKVSYAAVTALVIK